MQYGVRCMGKGPPLPMLHRWTCHVIQDGMRSYPKHSYGPFEFPCLERAQQFFERLNATTLAVCRKCTPT